MLAMVVVVGMSRQAAAQSRPLVTEDPETVPAGDILVEGGLDYDHSMFYPASGLTGNLLRIGTLGLSFGVSSIAEIQLDGGVRNHLSITDDVPAPLSDMLDIGGDATSTSDFEDLVIGTKVRFLSETASRPAVAVRFSTRLPNATNESGLGLDTTDFHFGLAASSAIRSVAIGRTTCWTTACRWRARWRRAWKSWGRSTAGSTRATASRRSGPKADRWSGWARA
jgi:hypothetical protein